ncbi:MAG: LuxR C-terminal-related transcriptional regulator [Solirubrobacteraceae bacterium]
MAAIGASVLVRLARLGPECVQLAQAVSILGPDARLRSAASLAALDLADARVAVDRLHDAQIVSAGQELSFVHPIVSEAVAAQVPPAHAAALHRQAARLLAEDGTPNDRVAAHLLLAEAVGDVETVDALRTAARNALARGAPEAAVSCLRRALAEPPPQPLQLPIMVELGRAEALLPIAQDFAALRQAMESATEPGERVEIARELALALCGVLRNVEARTLVEGLLDEIEDRLDATAFDSVAFILIAIGSDDLEAAPRVHLRAARYLERAERGEVTDPRMLAALAVEASLTSTSAQFATTLALRSLDDQRMLGEWLDSGYVTATVALTTSGALAPAAAAIDRGIAEAQRRGSAPMLLQLAIFRAEAALFAGDLDVAEDYSERAVAFGRALGSDQHAAIHTVVIHLERGRLEQALSVAESTEPASGTVWGSILLAERGRAWIASGDLARGLDDVLAAGVRMRKAGLALSCFSDWIPAAVDALVLLGRESEAAELAAAELADARAFGAARRFGIALSVCGSLDPGPDGLVALLEAVAVLESSPARLEHARALLRLGVGLRHRSDGVAARAALSASLDLADRCGGWALVERARAELVASGARPRRTRTSGPAALTPAEARAARMAAAGMSNREIAQALFLSAKTIEGQLSQAYMKLGIRSRAALREALGGGARGPVLSLSGSQTAAS